MERDTDDLSLIALSLRDRFSWAATRRLIEELGSPASVLRAGSADALFSTEEDDPLRSARRHVEECESIGVAVTSMWGSAYPAHLRAAHDAPPVLYYQGAFEPRDCKSVAVVGTRKPDIWGATFARDLAILLAESGIPVVSGLARGIDAIAMTAALDAGGRAVGVIGTGHGIFYPPEHRALHERVAQDLLLSQFSPGKHATKRTFPMRNIVMSGFSSVTVIAQAGETSGTRIQANAAVRHGKPVVLTKRVFESTVWARELVESGYQVEVVSTPYDAMQAARDLQDATVSDISMGLPALLSIG